MQWSRDILIYENFKNATEQVINLPLLDLYNNFLKIKIKYFIAGERPFMSISKQKI